VAIRLAAQGGAPRLYRLPRLVEVPGVLRGRLPPLDRVVGLDAESEFLFVTTAKKELLALDLGSGRVDTVGKDIAQAALGVGHAVVATGRNPKAVADTVGEADDLLVVELLAQVDAYRDLSSSLAIDELEPGGSET